MMKKIKHNEIIWINIENPNEKDVEFLKKNFQLHPSTIKEYLPPVKRSKVEQYKDYFFIVIHFPVFHKKDKKATSTELDIILFKNTVITSHAGLLSELKKMFRECDSNELIKSRYFKNNAVYLTYQILDRLIDTRMPILDQIDDQISEIEENLFKGNEKEMVRKIAIVKHRIISFRRIMKPQRMVLESLSRIAPQLARENLVKLSAEVIGSNIKVWHTLENHKEMIEALEHTNESLFSYKLNTTMKILTAFSVIVLPLSLMANTFGMNVTNGMPFVESPFGFLIVCGLMVIMTFISFLFFKLNKWI